MEETTGSFSWITGVCRTLFHDPVLRFSILRVQTSSYDRHLESDLGVSYVLPKDLCLIVSPLTTSMVNTDHVRLGCRHQGTTRGNGSIEKSTV